MTAGASLTDDGAAIPESHFEYRVCQCVPGHAYLFERPDDGAWEWIYDVPEPEHTQECLERRGVKSGWLNPP